MNHGDSSALARSLHQKIKIKNMINGDSPSANPSFMSSMSVLSGRLFLSLPVDIVES